MSVYLHDIPLSTAKATFQTALEQAGLWKVLGTENIQIDENAIGRVLVESVWARISSPHYHSSAMDGFAVRAEDTLGAEPANPITLGIAQQSNADKKGTAIYIDTGDALPVGYNAVIPIEDVESLDETGEASPKIRRPVRICIRAAVTPWSHVRPLGEDIVATQLVLPAGQVLRPVDLGAIAAAGHQSIDVSRKPRVAIIPTGSELVPIGSALNPGDILEYNSIVLAAQVKGWGGEAKRCSITKDDINLISARVEEAAREHDLVLLNAGSSAGEEDYSAQIVEKLGALLVHGVAVRPGHPVILGMLRRGVGGQVPIIGVPGYPVSAALTGEIFVEPLLAKWTGRHPHEPAVEPAQLTRKITSSSGDDDFIRVAVGKVGEKMLAAPLSRGAGVISSLLRADGLVHLAYGTQGAEAGEQVEVQLYRSRAELERTIFCIGSHDMTLDLLAQFLLLCERRLISANVGSVGGLTALKRGEAHLAGSHLLDPETGVYNISYIRRYLDGFPVKVYGFVGREQGLIVGKGNPKKIRSLNDLPGTSTQYINRQRGAGTRVLLDYELAKAGIPGTSIQGYNQEEYTHLAVAAAVASGRADCGLGIPAAAQALELDFVPLFQETYQLIIPKSFTESGLLAPLFDVMADKEFKNAILKMPGYQIDDLGKLKAEV